MYFCTVKTQKSHIEKDQKVNPFKKLMEDKLHIDKAYKEGKSLSSLKDIKFVRPI
jgi:hypothetical protein